MSKGVKRTKNETFRQSIGFIEKSLIMTEMYYESDTYSTTSSEVAEDIRFTKYCRRMYTGCDKIHCGYAHCPAELNQMVQHESYAFEGVKFKLPKVQPAPFRFVVNLDEDEELPAGCVNSISLEEIDQLSSTPLFEAIKEQWLTDIHIASYKKRYIMLIKEMHKNDVPYLGEMDMDWEYHCKE